jgi:nucleoside phosphorylase
MLDIPSAHVRRYWFGTADADAVADTALLMERDRLEQYRAALDVTLADFRGVFSGITGLLGGRRLTVVYSIGPAHVADCVRFLAHGFGVRRFFATGSIGGLATAMGDVVVANACATQDGFALAAFPGEVRPDERLGRFVEIDMGRPLAVSAAVQARTREAFGCAIHVGRLFTVPAVSVETAATLREIRARGYLALDLETGPFLAACRSVGAAGTCIHWVTDLPLERSFYYAYDGDPATVEHDRAVKHRQWLNMPRLILPVLTDLLAERPR